MQGLLKGQKSGDEQSDSSAHDAAVYVLQSSDGLLELIGRADQQQLALTITAIAAGKHFLVYLTNVHQLHSQHFAQHSASISIA